MRVQDPLLHPVRKEIFEYIEEHPGAFIGEMDRTLSYGSGTLHHHIRVLERCRLLTEEIEGSRRRFFVRGSVDRRERPRVAALANETLRRVYGTIEKTPGIHQTALAAELGISRAALRKHLRRLEEVGLIESDRHGRTVDYHIAGADEAWAEPELLIHPTLAELDDLEFEPKVGGRGRITRVDLHQPKVSD